MFSVVLIAIGFITNALSSYMYAAFFFIVPYFGFVHEKLIDKNMADFMHTVKHATLWCDNKPRGYIIGWIYLGYIAEDERSITILRYSTTLTKANVVEKLQLHYKQEGQYDKWIYSKRAPTTRIPYPWQKVVIEDIMTIYNKQTYCRILLSGSSGIGKSWIDMFIAQVLFETCDKVSIVEKLDLQRDESYFSNVYSEIKPTIKSPMMVVINEIDGIISSFSLPPKEGKYGSSGKFQASTKAEWNDFMDGFDREVYPHVIMIMTTNKTLQFFDDIDVSYFRTGRIDLKLDCDDVIDKLKSD